MTPGSEGPDEPLFWDKEGTPLNLDNFVLLRSDTEYRFVAVDVFGHVRVVTVWIGTDQGVGQGRPPLIFGTAALVEEEEGVQIVDALEWHAATEDEARRNHADMLELLAASEDLDD